MAGAIFGTLGRWFGMVLQCSHRSSGETAVLFQLGHVQIILRGRSCGKIL